MVLGDTSFSAELRKLIVKTVSKDPVTFNEGFLGKPNEDYCKWISEPERWGGEFEDTFEDTINIYLSYIRKIHIKSLIYTSHQPLMYLFHCFFD